MKTVLVGDVECGGPGLFLISGPCVVEDEDTMSETADRLAALSDRLGLQVIFKSSFQKDNRSSLVHYQGPGLDKGLAALARVRERSGLPVLSDVHAAEQAAPAAEALDALQIPAYLCMQTTLAVACARTGKPVNLKRGQFLAPQAMRLPVDKVRQSGNDRILVTERGFTFGYNDLVVDPRAFHDLRQIGVPVVFDVTHSIRRYGIPSNDAAGASRQYLGVLARAAVAAGIDGLFIETHPQPERALCDAASQMRLAALEEFVKPLIEWHALEVATREGPAPISGLPSR